MSRFSTLRHTLRAAGIAAAILIFGLPALAGEIYSWRTEDGGYAFTDDPKAIPPRYRDQAETRTTTRLSDYRRLTAPEAGTTDAYARRLANRLDQLRALNQILDEAEARSAGASAPVGGGLQSLSVQSGEFNVGVPTDAEGQGDAPLVIENIRFRHDNEMATRHNLVISKGDKLLAVIKGKATNTQINEPPKGLERID
jgi:hypothetical protein